MLLVGRLVYEKGFHLALDALPGLIRRVGKVRFLIAGSGTAEAELKAQAERLGLMEHGTFIGWTGDDVLHSLYRIADLCLVPSIYEPFGLVALEAMASGCPTIVADTGGLREVVPRGRRVGLRFRASSVRSLERMAQQLLTDDELRDRLVAEAREHVLRFDWAEVARETAGVYEGLVARRAAARRPAERRAPSDRAARPRARGAVAGAEAMPAQLRSSRSASCRTRSPGRRHRRSAWPRRRVRRVSVRHQVADARRERAPRSSAVWWTAVRHAGRGVKVAVGGPPRARRPAPSGDGQGRSPARAGRRRQPSDGRRLPARAEPRP